MYGTNTLQNCWIVLLADSQHRSIHFLAWPSMSWDHEETRIFWRNGKFSNPSTEIRVVHEHQKLCKITHTQLNTKKLNWNNDACDHKMFINKHKATHMKTSTVICTCVLNTEKNKTFAVLTKTKCTTWTKRRMHLHVKEIHRNINDHQMTEIQTQKTDQDERTKFVYDHRIHTCTFEHNFFF